LIAAKIRGGLGWRPDHSWQLPSSALLGGNHRHLAISNCVQTADSDAVAGRGTGDAIEGRDRVTGGQRQGLDRPPDATRLLGNEAS